MQTISRVTGVAMPTITDIDRRLVTAGLRSKGGRGAYVAQVSALDAARLLTGVLGSAQSNAAAEAVRRYETTRPDLERSSAGLFQAAEIPGLAHLQEIHGFVEGLHALLEAAAAGLPGHPPSGRHQAIAPRIEIIVLTRATRATLRISGLSTGMTASVEYGHGVRRGDVECGDLEQYRRVTEQTVYAVADLLREGQGHE